MEKYIITCNDRVSRLGFDDIENAFKWLEERNTVQLQGWKFQSKDKRLIYKIHCITFK